MKIFKLVLGSIFSLSFLWQLFGILTNPVSRGLDPEVYAIRVGTSMALYLILGILLIRSALKNKYKIENEAEHIKDVSQTSIKGKNIFLGLIIIILILTSFFLGTKYKGSSDKEAYLENKKILNRTLLDGCLERVYSLEDNPYQRIVVDECYRKWGEIE